LCRKRREIMARLSDGRWRVSVFYKVNLGYWWTAYADGMGIVDITSEVHSITEASTKSNWKIFARANGITKWEWGVV
jgi:hypothetical protein